jgi:hypothetical protein
LHEAVTDSGIWRCRHGINLGDFCPRGQKVATPQTNQGAIKAKEKKTVAEQPLSFGNAAKQKTVSWAKAANRPRAAKNFPASRRIFYRYFP